MSSEKVTEIRKALKDLLELSESELQELISPQEINNFFDAFLNPVDVKKYYPIAEFLLTHKTKLHLLALIRYFITNKYSIIYTGRKTPIYISPCHLQWFDDGVMYTEGGGPFQGTLYLYEKEAPKLVVFRRDASPGEKLGPNDAKLISIEEAKKLLATQVPDPITPIEHLSKLLVGRNADEEEYQKFFEGFPWVLGLEYSLIQNHTILDDANIPDFTGVRVRDNRRDIIEIKQPFIKIFREKDQEFSSQFNDSWNQLIRYLSIARQQRHYLADKGLLFDNPEAILIIGYRITENERKKIRAVETATPGTKVYTYDDVMKYMKHTINALEASKNKIEPETKKKE